MNKQEIINETVKYYDEDVDRRAISIHGCVYNGYDGTYCAIGRCLEDKWKRVDDDFVLEQNESDIQTMYEENGFNSLDEMLKPKYRGHKENFWEDLQRLHDNGSNWTYQGISSQGQATVYRLLKDWSEYDEE